MQNNSTSERSPNSPAGWPADAFSPIPSLAAAVGLALVYVSTTMSLLVVFRIPAQAVRHAQLTLPMVAVQTLTYVPVLAYMAFVLPALGRRSLASIFGRAGALSIAFGLACSIGMFVAVAATSAAQTAIFHEAPQQLAVRLFENASPGLALWLMIVVAVAIGPAVEELIFRGFIFNAARRRLPFWPAAVCSGLVFGAAHGEPAGILPLTAAGIVLAAVYARTGSLWASIATHGAFNAITLALLLFAGIRT